VKISIDKSRCTGHGQCYATAPGLVTDDEFGHGEVIGDGEVPSDQLEDAQRAAGACPEQAVVLET
jgi:ferredoxin